MKKGRIFTRKPITKKGFLKRGAFSISVALATKAAICDNRTGELEDDCLRLALLSRETANDSANMDEFMDALEAPIEDFVPVNNVDTPNDKKTHKEKLEVCVVYFFRYCRIPQVIMAHKFIDFYCLFRNFGWLPISSSSSTKMRLVRNTYSTFNRIRSTSHLDTYA